MGYFYTENVFVFSTSKKALDEIEAKIDIEWPDNMDYPIPHEKTAGDPYSFRTSVLDYAGYTGQFEYAGLHALHLHQYGSKLSASVEFLDEMDRLGLPWCVAAAVQGEILEVWAAESLPFSLKEWESSDVFWGLVGNREYYERRAAEENALHDERARREAFCRQNATLTDPSVELVSAVQAAFSRVEPSDIGFSFGWSWSLDDMDYWVCKVLDGRFAVIGRFGHSSSYPWAGGDIIVADREQPRKLFQVSVEAPAAAKVVFDRCVASYGRYTTHELPGRAGISFEGEEQLIRLALPLWGVEAIEPS
jgi:hypothetical protein